MLHALHTHTYTHTHTHTHTHAHTHMYAYIWDVRECCMLRKRQAVWNKLFSGAGSARSRASCVSISDTAFLKRALRSPRETRQSCITHTTTHTHTHNNTTTNNNNNNNTHTHPALSPRDASALRVRARAQRRGNARREIYRNANTRHIKAKAAWKQAGARTNHCTSKPARRR